MPIISTFHGIIIRMFYQEHGARHFHAEHQGDRATVLWDGTILAGTIRSAKARRLIQRWTAEHRAELQANWERVRTGQPLERIEPLQ
jgi:hypothetical protein